MSTDTYYNPEGFALEIFRKRYALHENETWLEQADRTATHVASAETGEHINKYKKEFYDIIAKNLFVPGGRIMYGSGRPKGQLLNCFVAPTNDSREGWGKTVSDMIIICGTGGGLGINFSPVRPRGSVINGTGGTATGSVSLMEIVNSAGEVIKAGGGRRTALMFALNLNHPDLEEFMDKKMDLDQLNNANVSIYFNDNPEHFFTLVKEDKDLELMSNGKVIRKISAKRIWDKIIQNALKQGEPGILNGFLANKMSNIWYYKPLICTNPCFAKGTLVHTKTGHFPIESLIGKTVEIWDGTNWVSIDNFRVTAENQKTLKITLHDGTEEVVTPYHKFILEDGSRVEARALQINDKLMMSSAPTTHGSHKETGAYLKGFLIADGSKYQNDSALLYLYHTKYMCINRLIESATELESGPINTNAIKELGFLDDGEGRKKMTGLAPLKNDLYKWVTDYKSRLPKEIFAWDKQSKLEFIAGIMDGDGTASDTKNGFMYQISSISKIMLMDLQYLLKTIGVYSHLSLMKEASVKDFNDGYGEYESQDCWRLTISQVSSVDLSKQVSFSRLISFAEKKVQYKISPKFNKIKKIEEWTTEDKVYCCTVPTNHSLALTNGLQLAQCGEIFLTEYDCCCLGALVLPRFVKDNEIDFDSLEKTIYTAVRFLDNVLTVNNYPLQEIKETCSNIRRIGLGIMGLHDMLLTLGMKYNSDKAIETVDHLMNFIKNKAYEASIALAQEKGPFPKFDADLFLKSGFAKTLKASTRSKIKEFGIRNCAILTIAPTGTTSMVSNVTSGIEPMFAPAYRRKYRDGDALKEEIVVHPLLKEFILAGKDVKHFQGAYNLKMKDHFEMQRTCQKHLDNACSKTINVPQGTSAEELSDLYMEYFPELKGVTVYPEGSREDQPLTPMTLKEAIAIIQAEAPTLEETQSGRCKSGVCEI